MDGFARQHVRRNFGQSVAIIEQAIDGDPGLVIDGHPTFGPDPDPLTDHVMRADPGKILRPQHIDIRMLDQLFRDSRCFQLQQHIGGGGKIIVKFGRDRELHGGVDPMTIAPKAARGAARHSWLLSQFA